MAAEIEQMTQYDWFSQARIHETHSDNDKAFKAYEEALKLDPKFAKAWFYKAKLHYKLGEKDQAKECVRRTLELEPDWERYVKKYMPDI